MINSTLINKDMPDDRREFFLNSKYSIVIIPAGTRLWKLSSFKGSDTTIGRIGPEPEHNEKLITPWWAPVSAFRDDVLGVRERYRRAAANGRDFRDEVRIASAVRIDWNGLNDYQEVVLTEDCKAFWGQFAPVNTRLTYKKLSDENAKAPAKYKLTTQQITQKLNKANNDLNKIKCRSKSFPDMLGGVPDAWQFFIPNLSKYKLKEQKTINTHDKKLVEICLGMN